MSIKDINFRVKYNVNILGVKGKEGMKLLPHAEYIFTADEHLMVIGHKRDVDKILQKL